MSGKAVAAGLGVAVAATAAAVAGAKNRSSDSTNGETLSVDTEPGSGGGQAGRMLTDEEIEAGASDVPLDASHTDRKP